MSEQEDFNLKDTNHILHVLRNTYGWNDHIVRNVRLIAADIIEQQFAEIAALRDFSFEVLDNLHRPSRLYLTALAQKYNLLDKDCQPTKLLTGESE